MDFFDSVSNSLLGVKEPEKDFFESVSEDLLSEDSYMTEFVDPASAALVAITAILGAISIGSTIVSTMPIVKKVQMFKKAKKNYEKANPDCVPLKKLTKKTFQVSGYDRKLTEIKKTLISKLELNFDPERIYAYFKDPKDTKPVCAFLVKMDGGIVRIALSSISTSAKKHAEYYFVSFAAPYGVGSYETAAWAEKWSKKDTDKKDEKVEKESVSESQSAINWERLKPFFLEGDDDDKESSLEQNLFESTDLSGEFFSESTITNLIMNPLSKLRATMSSNSIAKRGKENSKLASTYNEKISCDWDIRGIEQAVSMLSESISLFISKFVARELPNKETDYKTLSKVLKEYDDGFDDNLKELKETTLYTADKLNSEIMRANDVILNLCGKVAREAEKLKNSQDITVDQARLLSRCITIMNKGAGKAFDIFDRYMNKYHPKKVQSSAYNKGRDTGFVAGYAAGHAGHK